MKIILRTGIKTTGFCTTGLDPAGPVFARRDRKVRLDSTDAKFVDVLHSSFLYFIGVKGRAGDADFYVNGGGAQPGCPSAYSIQFFVVNSIFNSLLRNIILNGIIIKNKKLEN